jgi:preprotein translocase subunit SecY
MANIVTTVRNIFRIEELRNRIIFTLVALLGVRIGSFITLPGIDLNILRDASSNANSLLGVYDMFVGGALSNAAIFALGIMPYISASIVLQIGGLILPQLQKLQRDGEDGRRKINQYTRYLTVFIALLQGVGVVTSLLGTTTSTGLGAVLNPTLLWQISSVIILTAGTMGLMWIGEQITDKGLGNGISLIIFIGIIARFPTAISQEITLISEGQRNLVVDLLLLGAMVGIIAVVILITQGARRIPVQYAKRVVGRKVTNNTTTYIPLRVNTAGVMPIIFGQSILFIPGVLQSLFPENAFLNTVAQNFQEGEVLYAIVFGLMIVFFTYFYTAVAFNPKEVADNMKKNGGFIPGVRPGTATSDYIENIISRITLPGAIFLALIAIIPTFAITVLGVTPSIASFLGGTSLLIIVGSSLDTLQQIESYLLMRHYDGFMKSGKIRGRAGVAS